MTLACTHAYGMKDSKNDQKSQIQTRTNVKKDLAKGLTALAGATLFGYLSYALATNGHTQEQQVPDSESMIYVNFLERAHWTLLGIIRNYIEPKDKRIYFYAYYFTIPILSALAAYKSVKYSAKKLSSVITAKNPGITKKMFSTFSSNIRSTIRKPFSLIGDTLKNRKVNNENE